MKIEDYMRMPQVQAVGRCKECGEIRGFWFKGSVWQTNKKCNCGLINVERIERNDGTIYIEQEERPYTWEPLKNIIRARNAILITEES